MSLKNFVSTQASANSKGKNSNLKLLTFYFNTTFLFSPYKPLTRLLREVKDKGRKVGHRAGRRPPPEGKRN